MSVEDGLVMQLHVGSSRDHNHAISAEFGRDMGADIPTTSEFTRNLKPLLDLFGRERNLTLVLFNLDETTYGRELAPLAGYYPQHDVWDRTGGFLTACWGCAVSWIPSWRRRDFRIRPGLTTIHGLVGIRKKL